MQSDFHIHSIIMMILQLVIEIYISTFLANIIILYLLLQLIIYYSISVTNLDACHAEHITIMNKNFIHVHHMNFFLNTFDENSDQTFNLMINKIISYYNHD